MEEVQGLGTYLSAVFVAYGLQMIDEAIIRPLHHL